MLVTMMDYLHQLFDVGDITLVIVVSLSLYGAYLLREALDGGLLPLGAAPVFLLGSLISIRTFAEEGIVVSSDSSSDLVVATGVGLIVSLLLLLIAARLIMAVTGWRKAPIRNRVSTERVVDQSTT